MPSCSSIVARARACRLCAGHLAHGVRPVLQVHPRARILIASQAPGRKVHESGVPFDDASGERLRDWMGITRLVFYDAAKIAVVPVGLCYPGKGASGDLPPRPECAPLWQEPLLGCLPRLSLTLAVGGYAQARHLEPRATLTETVRDWRSYGDVMPLPHPSPRNNIWLGRNPWFERELVPELRRRVEAALSRGR